MQPTLTTSTKKSNKTYNVFSRYGKEKLADILADIAAESSNIEETPQSKNSHEKLPTKMTISTT